MGWNGSGTFNRSDGTRSGTQVWQDADAAGIKIRADDHDTHDQDIADGLENTVALDGQTTTTTDNAILRYDTGNSKFEGVNISASQIVGRSATGDTRSLSAATARQTIGLGTAASTNQQALFFSSANSQYEQKSDATARAFLGLGTAAATNDKLLAFSSSSNQFVETSYTSTDVSNVTGVITTEGDLMLGDSSGDESRLAIGSSNRVLRSNGTTASWGQVDYADLNLSNDLTQGDIANRAISQGELKTTRGDVSVGADSSANKTLAGGEYGFYPRTKISGGNFDAQIASTATPTSFTTNIFLKSNTSSTTTARQRYIQASPPYDLGDGECGLIVEVEVIANGKIGGTYVAPDPVWANNGPTNIRPDWIDKATGKKYKRVRRPAVTLADVDAGTADLSDYIAAQSEAVVEEVEITHAYKNADMDLFPHSWASPPQGTICLLDPVNTFDLLMLHEAGEDVADLIHKGYIKVGDKVNRKGPPGVTPVSWKWR